MTAAARQRAWRRRQVRNAIVVPVEVDYPLIEMMLEAGIVDEKGSTDRKTLGRKITVYFRNALADTEPKHR
nr:hypothetical protein [uncultured Shinella sp.]